METNRTRAQTVSPSEHKRTSTTRKQSYEQWWRATKGVGGDTKFLRWVARLIGIESGALVLDVGCGTGDFVALAAQRGALAVGVDFSSKSLTAGSLRNRQGHRVLCDSHALPFRGEVFDSLVCLGSLEHFADASTALSEMRRVVKKPTGKCLIFVPNSYFLGHVFMVMRTGEPPDEAGQYFSERFGTRMEWQRLLESSRLRVVSVHKYNAIWGSQKSRGGN